MDPKSREQLRFCSLCPNVCRILFPPGVLPKESNMSSALAYLAHGVMEGFIELTSDVAAQLASTEGVESCAAACPYGIDTARLATQVRREHLQE